MNIYDMSLEEFYEAFSAKNCFTNVITDNWNLACEWYRNGDPVMIFLKNEHYTTWNPLPAKN